MPITPRFHLSQTTSHLIITIQIPHIRVSASTLEIIVDKTEFHFYSNPYLLHLNFEDACNINNDRGAGIATKNRYLLDDESICKEAKATYDPSKDNGTVIVKIWKEVECIWEDLDLIGKLMMATYNDTRKYGKNNDDDRKEKIQVIASTETENNHDQKKENGFNEQNIPKEAGDESDEQTLEFFASGDLQSCLRPNYGFLNMHHSIFTDYAREGLSYEMLEIPNPDDISNHHHNHGDKREKRIEVENDKFCRDHYLDDFFLSDDYDSENADMIFIEAKHMIPHWKRYETDPELSLSTSDNSVNDITEQIKIMEVKEDPKTNDQCQKINYIPTDSSLSFFTKEESFQLASIKGQVPPISQIAPDQTNATLLSLIDILYAYVYDHRITCADPTVESSWTLVILSPTLSWLESYNPIYDTIDDVLRWSIRRALIYPYIRNFDMLSNLFIQDVLAILSCGRRVVIRCLLQIHAILDKSEFHYLFNKLYINQYICWMQLIDDNVLQDFVVKLKEKLLIDGIFDKDKFGLNLDLIEKEAMQAFEESSNEDDSSSSSSTSEYSSDEESSSGEREDTKDVSKVQTLIEQVSSIKVIGEESTETDAGKIQGEGKEKIGAILLDDIVGNHDEQQRSFSQEQQAEDESDAGTKVLITEI